jgi:serine/threonine protein phosphatase 1
MKKFVIGDIHSQCNKLKKLLQISGFNYQEDLLISLGDVVDRGPNPMSTIKELLKIKNTINIMGNHDYSFNIWCRNIEMKHLLDSKYGSNITMISYLNLTENKKNQIIDFLNSQIPYFIDDQNRLFIHAGIDMTSPISENTISTLIWDRTFFESVLSSQPSKNIKIRTIEDFSEIYIGHTPTTLFKKVGLKFKKSNNKSEFYDKPINIKNVWNMDTGCGYNHKLSMMNIETKEIFQT